MPLTLSSSVATRALRSSSSNLLRHHHDPQRPIIITRRRLSSGLLDESNKTSRRSRPTVDGLQQHQRRFTSATTKSSSLDMAYRPVNGFQMNQYVIACTTTRKAAIIDCGASSQTELDSFLEWIESKSYELTAIWQTHAHLDHIAGLGLLMGNANTGGLYDDIPIYLNEKEVELYKTFEQRCQTMGFTVEGGTDNLPDAESRLTLFDQEEFKSISLGELNFDIIPCPGHSPGQVGFYLEHHDDDDEEDDDDDEDQDDENNKTKTIKKSFFGGDFIMKGSIGRTDFPESNHADMETSLERFVKTMDDDTIIYPGHGPPTILSQEKQTNPFLRPYV